MSTKQIDVAPPGMRFAKTAFFGLAVLFVLLYFSYGISGNDFWWHVKVGQWIVENKQVPTTDIFSWYGTANNIPWVAHEWLSDVIFYWIYHSFGELGIFFLSLLGGLGMLILLWRQAGRNIDKNILISGAFFVLFAISINSFFYGRPHLFSFFLLFAELKLLYTFLEKPGFKGIFWIPIIAFIWSNIHGGSSNLSYLLCVVFLVVGLLKLQIGCITPEPLEKPAIIKLALVACLSVAAIAINPVGFKMLLYPYENMGDTVMLSLISEWQSPDAKDWSDLVLYMVPIALMMIGFLAQQKKLRMIDVAIMGMFILLFLRSIRFIMLWFIAATFCAFPYLPETKLQPISKKLEKALIIGFVILLMIPTGSAVINTCDTIKRGELISSVVSEEAIERVATDAPERIFNDYNLGEALIFHDLPVFFDARADVYAYENILADGGGLMLINQVDPKAETPYVDVQALIQKYNFDAFFILKIRPLYVYLMSHPEQYVCDYEDDTVAYFKVIQPSETAAP